MANPMVRSLYKSVDMEEDLSTTLVQMGGLWQMRGHFVVVFHAKSNGKINIRVS